MSAVWSKNQTDAAKRRADMIVMSWDGSSYIPAPPGTDFVAAGAVFFCGTSAPDLVLAAGTLTNKRRALVVADDTFTATHGTETFTAVAHGLETGDGPIRLTTTTTLPAGLSLATDYWVIKVDADNFQLAASLADAYAGTEVPISDNGTGTHTLSDTADTERGIWGHFSYLATQAETNHDGPESVIIVDGQVDGLDFRRMNNAGAYTTVNMSSSADDFWDTVIENGHSASDLLRGIARQNLATRIKSGTTETTRDLADSKDSHHGTVTASGRVATIDDLT